jgi:hypothetical protein
MTIRVNPDGSFDVDSPEQAVAISKLLANGHAPSRRQAHDHEPSAPPASNDGTPWETFLALAREKESKLAVLNAIRSKGKITLREMETELGVGSGNAVAGVMAGLTKNMKKARLKPAQVYKKSIEGRQPNTIVTYTAGPLLRDAPELK